MNASTILKGKRSALLVGGIFLLSLVMFGKRYLFSAEIPAPRFSGTYVLANLPIYRHTGNGVFKVDATAIIELATTLAVKKPDDSVSFDEASLTLNVVSSSENLKLLSETFTRMHKPLGLEFKKVQVDSAQLNDAIKGLNLKKGEAVRIDFKSGKMRLDVKQ